MTEKYDVALSFAAADEPVALQLKDALQPPLNVFVYSKAQEQLAGRDGIEAFRTVFLEHAHLVAILFRPPWGETPWTRVEKEAIEELALNNGWERLMFVRLSDAPVPKWVPKPHIYLDFTRFKLADLVGAIKARLQELEVEIRAITPAERAAAMARRHKFDEETAQLLSNSNREFVTAQEALCVEIATEAKAIAGATGWQIEAGPGALIGGFIITGRGQTLQIVPHKLHANTAREACLYIREYPTAIPVQVPGYNYYPTGSLDFTTTTPIHIRRLPDLGWCWELKGKTGTAKDTAQRVVEILLNRIEADRSGQ